MLVVKMLLKSNRVKALLVGVILGFLQKNFPDISVDEDTLMWIYGTIIAFVAGDTLRPVDPEKEGIKLVTK